MNTIKKTIVAEPLTLKLFLGITSVVLALGFFFGSATNSNYSAIQGLMHFQAWAMFFLVYSSSKIFQVLYKTKCWLRAFTSLVGMWAWSYIFLSFVIFDTTPMAPTEMMLLIPVLAEVWSLAGTFYTFNKEHI